MTPETIHRLRASLDAHVGQILDSLEREFVANQFIDRYKRIDNQTYTAALNDANASYRSVHVWVARHYLYELERRGLIACLHRHRHCTTWGNRPTRNMLWRID